MTMLQHGLVPSTGGYRIERSLRFNSADSAYLNRTPASASNRRTWTWSGWVKLSESSTGVLFAAEDAAGNASPYTAIYYINNRLELQRWGGSSYNIQVSTNNLLRDFSAWYHFVVAVDTTQATSANRVKLYINGVETSYNTATYPTQNFDTDVNFTQRHALGCLVRVSPNNFTGFSNQYLTEVNFIDGSAKTPSDFGETDTDTGVWKPKAYSGSYGTNGFYLKFADNSGTTSTTLGKDSSGNGNNWTPNNFSVTAGAGNDSLVDTPTPYGTDTGAGGEVRGNYCTLNPLDIYSSTSAPTFANGNLDASSSSVAFYRRAYGTFALFDNCYWEFTVGSGTLTNNAFGIASKTEDPYNVSGYYATEYAYRNTGAFVNNNSTIATYGSFSAGDIVRFAYSAGKLFVAINGTWQNSGNPAAGTGALVTGLTGSWKLLVAFDSTGVTHLLNAGQRPFAYTAPSGFKALCTQNLPTPTIGATATTRADDYFNTVLWSGDSTGTTRSISGVGFQPDFVWIKARNQPYRHTIYDAVRGAAADKYLSSSTNDAEGTSNYAGLYGYVSAFQSDGFQLTKGTDPSDQYAWINQTGTTYVGWNWKANGAGSTNNAGSIQSTVSASTLSGFSIVTYTGNGSTGTVGHGLNVAPSMIIVKVRSTTNDWGVGHTSIGWSQAALLNLTNAFGASSFFNSTAPTSTLFSVGNSAVTNASSATYVAYCFAPIAGYSAFGSYTGNGSADGTFIYTGFRPRYVMLKASGRVEAWYLFDTARNPYNVADNRLYANTSGAEGTGGSYGPDILSNGFKLRTSDSGFNFSGATYVYAAFAEVPTKFSLAR